MADIKVRIEVNPNAESELLGDINNINADVSNVSVKINTSNVFQNIPTSQSNGMNGLLLSQELVFDEQDYVDNEDLQGGVLESEENPSEFVWGIVPESKQYSVKLTFTNASSLKDIIVYGDQVANQFPTRAIIDGRTEIFSDDYRWAINLQTESDTHTIEFTHWNRANYNACLTLIRVMMKYFEIDKRSGLKSVESLSQSTGQPKEIFYGVVPSSGSLEVVDVDGEISDMVKDRTIPNNNINMGIYANGKCLQKHLSSFNEYITTSGSKHLSIQLQNTLALWDRINYAGYKLNLKTSLYEILKDVLLYSYSESEIDSMLSENVIIENREESIKWYLQQIEIPFPYMETSSLRDAIDKICQLAQLNVLTNDNGEIKFVSSRPISINKPIIKIFPKNQLSTLDVNLLVENKYQSINIEHVSTKIKDYSLYPKSIKYYEYEEITQKISSYNKIIGSDADITILYDQIPSETNSTTSPSGSFWYYYIAKFDVEENISDLTLMRNFINSKMKYSITSLHPTSTLPTSQSSDTSVGLSLYDSTYTDDEMISEWVIKTDTYETKIKRGTPNFGFKIRVNTDGTCTVFYVSLLLITNYRKDYAGADDDIITAVYNELSTDFLVPQISQTILNSSANAEITIKSNELLQNTSSFNDESIHKIIESNILSDYKNGILNGKISINCTDYYDINNNKVKDWLNGEILNVGDIVRIDNDNDGNSAMKYADGSDMYFRVTGRTFRHAGIPLIDLELQEVKVVG